MKKFRSARERLGLTQQQLAGFLGVSRGQLALAESSFRNLPANAALKLIDIELQVHNLPAGVDDLPETMKQPLKVRETPVLKKLERRLKECSIELAALQQKLIDAEQRHELNVRIMRFVALREQRPLPGTEAESEEILLGLLKAQVMYKMYDSSPAAQATLQMKINLLKFECTEIERILASLNLEL